MSLLWGSVNRGQPLHGLHVTESLRTSALQKGKKKRLVSLLALVTLCNIIQYVQIYIYYS